MLVDLVEQLAAKESKEVSITIKHKKMEDSDSDSPDLDAMFG